MFDRSKPTKWTKIQTVMEQSKCHFHRWTYDGTKRYKETDLNIVNKTYSVEKRQLFRHK